MKLWRKGIYTFAAVCGLSFTLMACSNDEKPAENNTADEPATERKQEARVMTDALGNEVTIPANPERIIASYLEDNLVALGVKPVAQWSVNDGASIQGYLQKELEGIPTVPHDLPFEAVGSHQPDLIIMDSPALVEGGKYDQYAKLAPTYVIGTEQNNDWRQELLTVGEILGKKDDAQKALDDYEAKAAEAKATLQEVAGDESVAAVWLVNNSFFIVSENLSSGAVMYGDLGLGAPAVVKEISANATSNWNSISLEKLVELDADHLFLINSDGDNAAAMSENLWKNIPAVKNGNVYQFSPDTAWLYTGAIANGQIIDHIMDNLVK